MINAANQLENEIKYFFGKYGYEGYLIFQEQLKQYNQKNNTSIELQYDSLEKRFTLLNSHKLTDHFLDYLTPNIKFFPLVICGEDQKKNKYVKFLCFENDHCHVDHKIKASAGKSI